MNVVIFGAFRKTGIKEEEKKKRRNVFTHRSFYFSSIKQLLDPLVSRFLGKYNQTENISRYTRSQSTNLLVV